MSVYDKKCFSKLVYSFQSFYSTFLVLRFEKNGSLQQAVSNKILTEKDHFRFCLAAIAAALHELHKMNIIHRDIKMDNIFFDDSGYSVIGDFGVSKILKKEGTIYDGAGTIDHMIIIFISHFFSISSCLNYCFI